MFANIVLSRIKATRNGQDHFIPRLKLYSRPELLNRISDVSLQSFTEEPLHCKSHMVYK